MESSKNTKVWRLNTKLWKWELETFLKDKLEDGEFMEDLIILCVIVSVILVLIFLLSIQISRSYFGASARTTLSTRGGALNNLEKEFVLNMDKIQRDEPPSYDKVVR